MKNSYPVLILAMAAFALAACQQQPGPDPVVDPSPQPETRNLSFVLPAFEVEDGAAVPASVKQAWMPGDQIVVHGEYARDQVTVTLTAADISSDGKTATLSVSGLYPYKRDDCASTLYASYPASISDNLKHCFFYSKFSTTNAQLLAACNDGDTFRFQNICGVLSFHVEGDFEGYMLSTPRKEALGYEFLQVKLTDKEQNYRQYAGDPVIAIESAMNGSDVLVYLPDGTHLSGITIKFKQNGAYTQILHLPDQILLDKGELVNLGDVTPLLEHYDDPFSADIKDLDTDGNANCYIVTAPGAYKFKAVIGNKPTQYVQDPVSADVVWETWNNNQEVTEGSVVVSASYAEDYIIIHMPETLQPGNAVIAVRNADDQILWSWHIWVPATSIVTGSFGGIMGNDFMDRNLGALVATRAEATPIDPLSYGMVYQWGRKDPFTGAGSFGSSTPATWAGEGDLVAPGQITLEASIANPRLMGHIDNGDWLITIDNGLWDSTDKTIYDPCPPTYRVPPMNGAPFWSSATSQTGWKVDSANGWITMGDPVAVFPFAGYRDDYGVGSMSHVKDRTLYWVANGVDAKGSGNDFRADKGTYSFGSAPKARLGSVRCVKEN